MQYRKYEFSRDGQPHEFESLPVEDNETFTCDEFLELDKRILTHQKILDNYHIYIWNDSHDYKVVNIENTRSIFLDKNELYTDLKTMIQMYNNEVTQAKKRGIKIRNGVWRLVFYQQLSSILFEIDCFNRNRELQQQFIEKAHSWALDTISKFDFQGKRAEKEHHKRQVGSAKRAQSAVTTKSGKTMRPQSGYPGTVIDGFAETTVDNSYRPESAITGNHQLKDSYLSNYTKQLPSEFIQEKLKDYRTHARTKHDEFEPPEERLIQRKRRIIHIMGQPNKRPKTAVERTQGSKTFPKPPKSAKLQDPLIKEENEEEEEPIDEEEEVEQPKVNQENQNAPPTEPNNDIQGQPVQIVEIKKKIAEDPKKKEGYLDPLIKVFKNDEQLDDMFRRELDFETKDNYQIYMTSKAPGELNRQQQYQNQVAKEVAEKRQDEEQIQQHKLWANYKGRIEKEINRRVESANLGNKAREMKFTERTDKEQDLKELNKIRYQHEQSYLRSQQERDLELSDLSIEVDNETGNIGIQQVNFQTQLPPAAPQSKPLNNMDITNLEQQIRNQAISKIKHAHGQLLGLVPPEDESSKLKPEQSMSIYGKNQNFKKQQRPFSAILTSHATDLTRQEQIKEIEEIKLRLAKHNVQVPVHKLVTAMLIPDPVNVKDPNGINLPPAGFGILQNPFEKKKKKKKKKGKR